MDLALALGGVDVTLFDSAHQASTTASLSSALAAAANVPAATVSIRRVRDMSNAAAPIVLYVNPQFAGDSFPARRLQPARRLAIAALVSVDAQIQQASNSAAAALSTTLATGSFAADVKVALINSPLASAQVAAFVQPYPGTGGAAASASGAPTGSSALVAGAAAAAIVVLTVGGLAFYRGKRRRSALVAPAPSVEPSAAMPAASAPSKFGSSLTARVAPMPYTQASAPAMAPAEAPATVPALAPAMAPATAPATAQVAALTMVPATTSTTTNEDPQTFEDNIHAEHNGVQVSNNVASARQQSAWTT